MASIGRDYKYQKWLDLSLENLKKQDKSTSIGIALFGIGRAGQIHLKNCLSSPNVELLYCVENNVEYTDILVEKLNIRATMLSYDEADKVFEDERVEGIIVATPTFTHEEIVRKSINKGKAVLCEKPISLDELVTADLLKLSQDKDVPLLVAMNRRFDPAMSDVIKAVQSGDIGDVISIKTCSRDSPEPSKEYIKISGGFVHDCLIHDIDLICHTVNEYPLSIFIFGHQHGTKYQELGDIDSAMVVMKFQSGIIATIDACRYSSYGYDQRLEVHGRNGTLRSENQNPTCVNRSSEVGCTSVPIYFSFPSRYMDAYSNELTHFLDIIQGKCKSFIDATSILKVMKVCEACQESLQSGQVVKIDWS